VVGGDQDAGGIDAIAAVFDLEGFTSFSSQIDPHFSVPLFLKKFLFWFLDQIKEEMTESKGEMGVSLWCPLPFMVKFMGDGLLVLWDASQTDRVGRANIIVSAHAICQKYKTVFLREIAAQIARPPELLRCGIARGAVYSVGDGGDFVGSCINMASRIEKLHGSTFAFNRRGFDLESPEVTFLNDVVVVKKVYIDGVGEGELIALFEDGFNQICPENKEKFLCP
jgi:class 3 adenylate cyclase